MARVRQWIGGFLKRHKARFDPRDWPPVEEAEDYRVFVEMWLTAFATREVVEAEADEASRALGPTPPNFRREHLPMVLATIEASRQRRGVQPVTSTREAARDASRDCPHCGSEGLAVAWAECPDAARRIPETVAAHCVCAHGRFIRKIHAEKSPEMLRRIPDFGEVLDRVKPGWLPHPPGRPELAAVPDDDSVPMETDPVRAITRAEIAAMFRPTD